MKSKYWLAVTLGAFTGGLLVGIGLGTRATLDLVAGAYGSPREEVIQQIDWYIQSPTDDATVADP